MNQLENPDCGKNVSSESYLINYIGKMRGIYDSLISGEQKTRVSYGKNAPEIPKLILRAANMSGVSQKDVISAIEKWEGFKVSEGVLDIGLTPRKEIALAVYVYCYNDSTKDTKILTILKELNIGVSNSNLGFHIQELCKNNLEPSKNKETIPSFS